MSSVTFSAPFRMGTRALVLGLMASALWAGAHASAQDQEEQRHPDLSTIEPFASETTFLVVKLDLQRLKTPQFDETLTKLPEEMRAAAADFSQALSAQVSRLHELTEGQPIYVTVGIPLSKSRIPFVLFVQKPGEEKAESLVRYLGEQMRFEAEIDGNYVVARPPFEAPKTSLRPAPAILLKQVGEALASVSEYPIQLCIVVPEHVRRTVNELAPELPGTLGGGSSTILTDGVQWLAVGIDLEKPGGQVIIQSASTFAAERLAEYLPVMAKAAYDSLPDLNKRLPANMMSLFLEWLDPQIEGDRLIMRIDGSKDTAAGMALLNVLAKVTQENAEHVALTQRFKQILLAMHNYYDVHEMFPPRDKYRDANGELQFSWRVHLLPYLDEQELYREFRLEEPWDSPHNKKLLDRMPDVYKSQPLALSPQQLPKPGHTTFLAPVGEGTVFGGKKSTTFREIRDGTSNTIVLVQVAPERAVPWTAPVDYRVDPEKPLAGVQIGPKGEWVSGFADGSARVLPSDIPTTTVLHLFQMDDGQPIDYDELK